MNPALASTCALALTLLAPVVLAATPAEIGQALAVAAARESPGFDGFSAARGAAFFNATHGNQWSCASCHTPNPVTGGRHARTGKAIDPLAPAANADRFTDPAQVEKWFRRNCNDVLGRACTAREKGDVLAWLMSQGKGGAQ
jgi:hypothetical protein